MQRCPMFTDSFTIYIHELPLVYYGLDWKPKIQVWIIWSFPQGIYSLEEEIDEQINAHD